MPRAVWKGPFVAVNLLRQVIDLAKKHPEWWNKTRFQGVSAPEIIQTTSRRSTILPDFLGIKFSVHNGKAYLPLTVTEPMIGHKLGEFSFTKKYYDPPASKKSKAGSKRGATGRLK